MHIASRIIGVRYNMMMCGLLSDASFFQLQHKLGMLVVDTTFCLEDGGGQSFVLQQRTEKKLSNKLLISNYIASKVYSLQKMLQILRSLLLHPCGHLTWLLR